MPGSAAQLWTHNGVGAILRLGRRQPGIVCLGPPPPLHLRQALLRAPLPPLQLQRMRHNSSLSRAAPGGSCASAVLQSKCCWYEVSGQSVSSNMLTSLC